MKKRKFTVEEKLGVVSELESSTVSAVAKRHKLDRKTVRQWRDQKRELQYVNSGSYRLPGGGRFIGSEELEFTLLELIERHRKAGERVTRNMIVHWAGRWVADNTETELQVSSGWLERFLERNNLVLRRATSKPKLTADDVVDRGVKFIEHVRQLIKEHNIEASNIYNMDETAVFLDHGRSTTIEERGRRDVYIKSFGLEKNRVTAVFAPSATGKKLKPALMTKGAPSRMHLVDGVVMMTGGNAWMTTDWFTQWVDYYFPMPPRNKILLVFDSARSHISKQAKTHLKARGILFCVIPGGMTAHLQPADYARFKPLKDRIMECIDAWERSGDFDYTRGGNVRAPRYGIVREWIKEAWNAVSCETIINSFRRCFLGDINQLCLSRHSVYGEAFVEALTAQRALRAQGTLDGNESSCDLEELDNVITSASEDL